MNTATAARIGIGLWLATSCFVVYAAAAPFKLNPPIPLDGDVETPFRLSADGTQVLYVADQDAASVFELYKVSINGGASQKLSGGLVNGGDVVPESVQFSPSGNRVLYVADANVDEVLELFSVASSGGAVVKLNGALPISGGVDPASPRFTPDGNGVVYRADQANDQVFELYDVSSIGGGIKKLSGNLVNGGDVVSAPVVSPDGTRVLYVADQDTDEVFELYSGFMNGAAAAKLSGTMVLGGGVVGGSQKYSPNGGRVMYVADQNTNEAFELFTVPSTGGVPTKVSGALVSGGDVSSTSSVFSPDSSRIVYRADQDQDNIFELYSVPSAGGSSVKISGPMVSAGDVVDGSARISPDSAHVIYLADEETNEKFELYEAPILGGSAPLKLNGVLPSQGDVTAAEFTPDGSRVIYLASEDSVNTFELFSVSSSGTG
jgi:Tol biopolymer transport system component